MEVFYANSGNSKDLRHRQNRTEGIGPKMGGTAILGRREFRLQTGKITLFTPYFSDKTTSVVPKQPKSNLIYLISTHQKNEVNKVMLTEGPLLLRLLC